MRAGVIESEASRCSGERRQAGRSRYGRRGRPRYPQRGRRRAVARARRVNNLAFVSDDRCHHARELADLRGGRPLLERDRAERHDVVAFEPRSHRGTRGGSHPADRSALGAPLAHARHVGDDGEHLGAGTIDDDAGGLLDHHHVLHPGSVDAYLRIPTVSVHRTDQARAAGQSSVRRVASVPPSMVMTEPQKKPASADRR